MLPVLGLGWELYAPRAEAADEAEKHTKSDKKRQTNTQTHRSVLLRSKRKKKKLSADSF